MDEKKTLVLFAEEAEMDIERSDIFLLIDFKLFDNGSNGNKEGVTSAFISSIANDEEKYSALPQYADVPSLINRRYRELGHMYNPRTGTFGTSQIGGMVGFQMVAGNDGFVSLHGTARVPKRQKDICERQIELYRLGRLNVSFEITYNPDKTVLKDGIQFVDADEENYLTGMAVVWTPAYEDATALNLVAEAKENAQVGQEEMEMFEGDEKGMPNDMNLSEAVETESVEIVAEQNTEEVEVKIEETIAEKAEEENAEKIDEAECGKRKEADENAETEHAEAEIIHQSIEVNERIEQYEDEAPVHIVEKKEVVVETVDAPAPDERDRTIAELQERIKVLEQCEAELNKLKSEIAAAELKKEQDKASNFAQKQGLDVNDEKVAKAINDVDYKAIASLVMEKEPEEKKNENGVAIASFTMTEGMTISGEYGGLLERRKN